MPRYKHDRTGSRLRAAGLLQNIRDGPTPRLRLARPAKRVAPVPPQAPVFLSSFAPFAPLREPIFSNLFLC